ncbi:biogenesis of lysosome-related organelles complex 1 subunit Snn1p [Monosporozyma unispora]
MCIVDEVALRLQKTETSGMSITSDEVTVHPVELSVYSIVSSNLDGIQQSINELRESQAILIITMRKISQSLKQEDKLLYESEDFKLWSKELTSLESRLKVLYKRYSKLSLKNQSLLQQSTADSNSTS